MEHGAPLIGTGGRIVGSIRLGNAKQRAWAMEDFATVTRSNQWSPMAELIGGNLQRKFPAAETFEEKRF